VRRLRYATWSSRRSVPGTDRDLLKQAHECALYRFGGRSEQRRRVELNRRRKPSRARLRVFVARATTAAEALEERAPLGPQGPQSTRRNSIWKARSPACSTLAEGVPSACRQGAGGVTSDLPGGDHARQADEAPQIAPSRPDGPSRVDDAVFDLGTLSDGHPVQHGGGAAQDAGRDAQTEQHSPNGGQCGAGMRDSPTLTV